MGNTIKKILNSLGLYTREQYELEKKSSGRYYARIWRSKQYIMYDDRFEFEKLMDILDGRDRRTGRNKQ